MTRMTWFKTGTEILAPLAGVFVGCILTSSCFLSILMLWSSCAGPPGPRVASKPVGPWSRMTHFKTGPKIIDPLGGSVLGVFRL